MGIQSCEPPVFHQNKTKAQPKVRHVTRTFGSASGREGESTAYQSTVTVSESRVLLPVLLCDTAKAQAKVRCAWLPRKAAKARAF